MTVVGGQILKLEHENIGPGPHLIHSHLVNAAAIVPTLVHPHLVDADGIIHIPTCCLDAAIVTTDLVPNHLPEVGIGVGTVAKGPLHQYTSAVPAVAPPPFLLDLPDPPLGLPEAPLPIGGLLAPPHPGR